MIIVLFHVLYLVGKFVFRRYNGEDSRFFGLGIMDQQQQQRNADEEEDKDEPAYVDVGAQSKAMKDQANLRRRCSEDDAHEEASSKIRFSPPAFIQRYQAVQEVLMDKRYGGKLKKVVDFGCSELGFCMYLKNMVGVEEALFVDVDRTTLDYYKEKARPLHADYLHRRSSPLIFRVLEGSVTEHDKFVESCDAVVCIELVEHLYPEPLTNLPYNIFGFIRPKVAIVTTPNADFNVLFGKMSGFRHWDHKFEWTRQEFQDWANNIVLRFPEYEVTFHGICNGPAGTEHLGACSQMAVFHKAYELQLVKVPAVEGLYKPVAEYEYPFEVDNRSDEQKILDDAVYYIRKFSGNSEELAEEIPLQMLLDVLKKFYISLNDLKEILENANWNVADRDEGLVVLVPPPSSFSDHSFIEDDFMDNEVPPGYYDWDEEPPGPPADYFDHTAGTDINIVDEEDWEIEPSVVVVSRAENQNDESTDVDGQLLVDSTASILDLEDIETERPFVELDSSPVEETVLISSFSELKDSDNSETGRDPCLDAQTSSINIDNITAATSTLFFTPESAKNSKLANSATNSTDVFFSKDNSMCSMFLEPSQMSGDVQLEDSTDAILESTITSPSNNSSTNKKPKLDNSVPLANNVNENSFNEPKYTSSPHVSSSCVSLRRKVATQRTECSTLGSNSSSSEDLMFCTNEQSKDAQQTSDDPNTCNSESVVLIDNIRDYSPQTCDSNATRQQHTGTIPKNFHTKFSDYARANAQKETPFDGSPATPESLPNSYSPEIMDSGYPNSNSPPDLSPEYDLSSIAQDRSSGSTSPSIADLPKMNFFDLADAENVDLANNNLDGEGNNIEAEENRRINDFQPLMNVLENDLQNENDIYVVDAFPAWLLRILRRFDPDGVVGINVPILQPPNENFE